MMNYEIIGLRAPEAQLASELSIKIKYHLSPENVILSQRHPLSIKTVHLQIITVVIKVSNLTAFNDDDEKIFA